jgi:hypothetical protein
MGDHFGNPREQRVDRVSRQFFENNAGEERPAGDFAILGTSTMSEVRSFNAFPHLDSLLADFAASVISAQKLKTSNTDDDELIRCSKFGFSRHTSLDKWNYDHFRYVKLLQDEVSTEDFSGGWRRFTCLAAGYFLGMRVAGTINDVDLLFSQSHTPGFMWMHAQAIDGGEGAGSPGAQ